MKKAFSLVELMIVVVIMGVVYMLAVHNLQEVKDPEHGLRPETLKAYLQDIPHKNSVELLCLDDCSGCDILVDGKRDPEVPSIEDFLDESVKVYRYDFHEGLQEQRPNVYFNEDSIEKKVCFSLSIDAKGLSEQVAVLFKEKVYDYTAYFTPTPVYGSLQEFVNAKESSVGALRR